MNTICIVLLTLIFLTPIFNLTIILPSKTLKVSRKIMLVFLISLLIITYLISKY
jgi:hypothetical protein